MRPTADQQARRRALLIATSSYEDPALSELRATGEDAKGLAEVLEHSAIGGSEVNTVLNAPATIIMQQVAELCQEADPHDLLLIYLSCHGLLDDYGQLYYATVDTRSTLLSATAIEADWLNRRLEESRARRQVLILDCCHSGAFAKGAKGGPTLALEERFGRGRAVLTASRATEYAFVSNRFLGQSKSSVFTRALIDGMRSGEADIDGNGLITTTELYDYAHSVVKADNPRQNPGIWTFSGEGSLVVAYVRPVPLPEHLVAALESLIPHVRQGAVAELARLLAGPDAAAALTARERLEHIADHDSPPIADAARRILDTHPKPSIQSFQPTNWLERAAIQLARWLSQVSEPLARWLSHIIGLVPTRHAVSLWTRRGLAELIDLLLVLPIAVLPALIQVVLSWPFGDRRDGLQIALIVSLVTLLICIMVYQTVALIHKGGATVGKRKARLKVITMHGDSPTLLQTMLREIIGKWVLFRMGGVASFGALTLVDHFWPLWQREQRALHDFVGYTKVISTDPE
jgi:uncharacterized RDD family membrane protein YckC